MPKLSEIAKKLFLIWINYFLKKQDVLFLLIYVLSYFHLSPPPPPQPQQVSKGKESPPSKQIDLLWQRVNIFPLMLRTSTFKSLYGGKITISTQLI